MTTKAEVDVDLGNIHAELDLGLDDVQVDMGLDDINVATTATVNARAELGTKSELTTRSDVGAHVDIGAKADLSARADLSTKTELDAKADVHAKVDLGLDDIKAKVGADLVAAIRELAPVIFQFLWKEIPIVRVAMPHRYKLGFNLFGHEMASLTFCGESEIVTEDHRRRMGGSHGP